MHLRELLERAARGETVDFDIGVEHLISQCAQCRRELGELMDLARGGELGLAFERSLVRVKEALARVERERGEGRDALVLLAMSPTERCQVVARSRRRFRSLAVVDALLEESRRRLLSDPVEALDIAEIAQQVALRVPDRERLGIAVSAVARASGYKANAWRVLGKFREAELLLLHALHLFQRQGDCDPLVEGELLEIGAAIHREMRRFDEALVGLRAAAEIYAELRDEQREARVSLSEGTVLYELGRYEEALETATAAAVIVGAGDELFPLAMHNAVLYCIALGRVVQARGLLEDHPELEQVSGVMRLRFVWVVAQLAAAEGDLARAEELLREAREGFEREGLGYDAALVCLDLSAVLLEVGRSAEVLAIAEGLFGVFLARDVNREATAVLVLFLEAARQGTVTREVVVSLRRQFEGTRARPMERPS